MIGQPLVLKGVVGNQPKEGCGVFGDLFFGKKAEKEEN
jgi:hypothetical protein